MNRNEVQLVAANEELRATVRELEDRHSKLVIERDRLREALEGLYMESIPFLPNSLAPARLTKARRR